MTEFRRREKRMGSAFELVVVSKNKEKADSLLDQGFAEIQRIEELLSEYRAGSVTSRVNNAAGENAVSVPTEFYQLVKRCLDLSRLTQGAFDITLSPLKSLYDFTQKRLRVPDKQSLKEALAKTGFRHIELLDNNRIKLRKRGGVLSFASIGKGYAADRVKTIWQAAGVRGGVVNASGDLSVIGAKPDGSPWNIVVADPRNLERPLLHIPIREGSIATSGDSIQYFEHKGVRYSHTINPATGLPVSGIKSVSIQGVSGELCDALATAVTVMGVEVGLHFINQLPKTHCLIIDDQNALHFSKKIKFEHLN